MNFTLCCIDTGECGGWECGRGFIGWLSWNIHLLALSVHLTVQLLQEAPSPLLDVLKFFFEYVCVCLLNRSVVSNSLQPPWTVARQAPSVHGIF